MDLNLRKNLIKCYIKSIALYGAESWPLQKVDQKYLTSFEKKLEKDREDQSEQLCEK